MLPIKDEKKHDQQTIKFFVLVNCYEGETEQTASELKEIDCIKEVRELYDGPYDILVILESNSEYVLKNIISNKIRKLGSIRSTLTLQSCKNLEMEA